MPTRRIGRGPTGRVIAYTQEIDQWINHELAESRGEAKGMNLICRSRELRAELRQTRRTFRRETDLLKAELATVRTRATKLPKLGKNDANKNES